VPVSGPLGALTHFFSFLFVVPITVGTPPQCFLVCSRGFPVTLLAGYRRLCFFFSQRETPFFFLQVMDFYFFFFGLLSLCDCGPIFRVRTLWGLSARDFHFRICSGFDDGGPSRWLSSVCLPYPPLFISLVLSLAGLTPLRSGPCLFFVQRLKDPCDGPVA